MGRLLVDDARLFGPSGRSFARRLVESLCMRPGVRSAQVDSETFRCRVDFDLDSARPEIMARIFVEALGASSGPTRKGWWPTRSPRWSSLVAYRHLGNVSSWEFHTEPPGRLRLVRRGPTGGRAAASRLADAIADLDEVEGCNVSLWSQRITVDLRPSGGATVQRTLGRVESILEGRRPVDRIPAGTTPGGSALETVAGWKRFAYVALAGGSFSLAVIGKVLPGVPTVPFLLATSDYLARSWPRLDDRLRHTPFFGPTLQEWEGHSALSRTSRGKLIGLSKAIVVVTLIFSPLGVVALASVFLISSWSAYGVARIPALERGEQNDRYAAIGAALPAPAG
jgi:uncharacterized membrane protein YbaN (DUF454 family)